MCCGGRDDALWPGCKQATQRFASLGSCSANTALCPGCLCAGRRGERGPVTTTKLAFSVNHRGKRAGEGPGGCAGCEVTSPCRALSCTVPGLLPGHVRAVTVPTPPTTLSCTQPGLPPFCLQPRWSLSPWRLCRRQWGPAAAARRRWRPLRAPDVPMPPAERLTPPPKRHL